MRKWDEMRWDEMRCGYFCTIWLYENIAHTLLYCIFFYHWTKFLDLAQLVEHTTVTANPTLYGRWFDSGNREIVLLRYLPSNWRVIAMLLARRKPHRSFIASSRWDAFEKTSANSYVARYGTLSIIYSIPYTQSTFVPWSFSELPRKQKGRYFILPNLYSMQRC